MEFTIAGTVYPVVIASRPIILDGRPAVAKIDRAGKRIIISDQLPRHERRVTLLHELRHAWLDQHGIATDAEADAEQAAHMMDAVMAQYDEQGGDAVLEGLHPDPVESSHRQVAGVMGSFTRECGCCGSPVCSGSIEESPPEWNGDAAAWTMDRRMPCDACGSVTAWREHCTQEGMPLGTILPFPKPRVLAAAR